MVRRRTRRRPRMPSRRRANRFATEESSCLAENKARGRLLGRSFSFFGSITLAGAASSGRARLAGNGSVEKPYEISLGSIAAHPRDIPATSLLGREEARRRAWLGTAGLLALLWALITTAITLGRMADGPWSAAVHPFDYRAALLVHSLQSPLFDLPLRSLSWIGEMVPMSAATGAFFA